MKLKLSSVRAVALVAAVTFVSLASTGCATTDSSLVVQTGSQGPPPPRQDYQWQRPSRTAVWVPGHYEYTHGRYVWIAGYYSYPPQGKSHWISPRYVQHQNGYTYQPGHWSN